MNREEEFKLNHITKFFDGNEVRIVEIDGNPWFVAKDVCRVLGIDPTQIRRLKENQKGLHTIQTPGGMQKMAIISEQGVYKLAFTSRKPEAERFTDWVAEVIETIRKTGGYIHDSQRMVDTYFSALPTEQKTIIKAMFDNIAALQKKALKWEEFLDSDGTMTITSLAKMLGTTEPKLRSMLIASGIISRAKRDGARFAKAGYESWFKRIPYTTITPYGDMTTFTLKVTREGVDHIISMYKGDNDDNKE